MSIELPLNRDICVWIYISTKGIFASKLMLNTKKRVTKSLETEPTP